MAQDLTLSTRASAAFYGFSTKFSEGYQKAPAWWSKVATKIPSDTETEIHAWLELIPGFSEWRDERKFYNVGSADYTLTNADFATGMKLPRNKLADDKIGLYVNNAEMLGVQAAKWPDKLVADRMKNGQESGAKYKCFDGQAFFSASHPKSVNGQVTGTFSNLKTSRALTAANFNTTYADLMSIPGPDGEAMGLIPTALFVPPALRETALTIVKAGVIPNSAVAASQSNINQGVVDVEIIPELAGADADWYLGATMGPIKPLVFQIRQEPGFDEIAGLTSEHCKLKKELLYGSDSRGAFGYSFPHFLIKCRG
jgi:phage major head subunit gpT-like protein